MLRRREWKRIQAVRCALSGRWTMREAAESVGLSERQMRRLSQAVDRRGEAAVLHGNRGRRPANQKQEKERRRVVELARKKYTGFNDQHFTEKLASVEGIAVSRSTVRRWLRAAGVGAARKRRPPAHRRRRDRKAQAGLMLLWDGSRHDWLEGRGPLLCLVGAIDDATSEFLPGAHFVEQECAAAYMRVLRAVAEDKGLPWSCYGDRHGIFRRNDDVWTLEEELRGQQDPTQLGRVLDELGIERIDALSPQAKGRVERLWGTLQDRLTSELRLAKVCGLDEANRVLEGYRADHNRRFALPAAHAQDAWRAIPRGLRIEQAICFRYAATVLNDNTVRLDGVCLDIPPGPGGRSYAKARVEVRQLLDGSWRVCHQGRVIALAAPTTPGELRPRRARKRPAASRAFREAVLRLP